MNHSFSRRRRRRHFLAPVVVVVLAAVKSSSSRFSGDCGLLLFLRPLREPTNTKEHTKLLAFFYLFLSPAGAKAHTIILLIYFCVLVHFCVHFQTIPTTSRGNSAAVFFMDLNFRLGRKTKPGTVSLFSGLIPKNDTPILSQVGTLRLQGNNE